MLGRTVPGLGVLLLRGKVEIGSRWARVGWGVAPHEVAVTQVVNARALPRVRLARAANEFPSRGRQGRGADEIDAIRCGGLLADKERVEDEAERPDVDAVVVLAAFRELLGRRVRQVAEQRGVVGTLEPLGEAEVGDLACLVAGRVDGDEDVGRLEAAVGYTLRVQVLEAVEDLRHGGAGDVFGHRAFAAHRVEQGTAAALHDESGVGTAAANYGERLVRFYHVPVVEPERDVRLTIDAERRGVGVRDELDRVIPLGRLGRRGLEGRAVHLAGDAKAQEPMKLDAPARAVIELRCLGGGRHARN
mmetsp:Transcript_26944/g.83397  ORF Transcript_26944/g.83397 Transcript_26944/m.83397 type:complete len:304 (+) Transcript_26944:305-1216(+)